MNLHALACTITAAALLLTAVTGHAGESIIEGVARTLPAGDIVYRERHTIIGNRHHILYTDPNGTLIAEKSLDYGCDDAAPDWQQHDMRSGERLGGHWKGSEYVLERDDRSSSIRPVDTLVASSGFDRFVRNHWEQLRRGETLEFEFALAARLSTIGMRIHGTTAPLDDGRAKAWFTVEPSSGLFRLFAGSILLGYADNGELSFYRGPSNIGDGKGGSLTVEIRYRHVDESPQLAAAPEPTPPANRSEQDLRCTRHDA